MDFNTIIAYIFGGIVTYIAIWIFYKPLKSLMKIAVKATFGCLGIVIFNFIFSFLGVNIGINIGSSLIAGLLGVPGLCMLVFLQRIFVA